MVSGRAREAQRGAAAVTCRDDALERLPAGVGAPIGPKTRTVRAHAQATTLLERWGSPGEPRPRPGDVPGDHRAAGDGQRRCAPGARGAAAVTCRDDDLERLRAGVGGGTGRSPRTRSSATSSGSNIVPGIPLWKGTPSADDLRGWATPVATDPRRTRAERPSARTGSSPTHVFAAAARAARTQRRSARGRARTGAGRPSRGGRRHREAS